MGAKPATMPGMPNEDQNGAVAGEWHLKLFRKSLLKQAKLRRIVGLLGATRGEDCLDVGGDNGVVSYHLRALGGTWTSVDMSEKAVESIRKLVGENVKLIQPPALPFPDETFDVLVIIDLLEHVEDDAAFIAECHRVLKPTGRLIVNVPHIKRFAFLPPIRNMLGLTDDIHGHVRPGYTQSQLFDLLKDGFNVEEVQTYSRFFVEALDTGIRFLADRFGGGAGDPKGTMIDEENFGRMDKLFRVYSILYPFFWLASKLDYLLFWTRGYCLIARAKCRQWRPRRAPVLRDGRSIAEAALGGKIGSAAPF